MVSVVACLVLGLVLLASAVLKLVDPAGTRAALATYGVRREELARVLWGALVAVEAVLAVGVGAGIDAAAYAAAGLLAVFCVAQAVVLATGRGGAPCACFGARGRVSRLEFETGECRRLHEAHEDWIRAVHVTPDGRYIVSVSQNFICRVYDIKARRLLDLDALRAPIPAAAVSADAEVVAITGHGMVVRVAPGR